MVSFMRAVWFFTLSYIKGVNDYTSEYSERRLFQVAPLRYLFRFFLWLFAPVIFLIVPAGFAATIVAAFVLIDQATVPNFSVDSRFVHIAEAVNGQKPELKDIGATLFAATYLQMEHELDTPILGWTPNDVAGLQLWDNRVNRQLGVLHASRELLEVMSIAISKLGSADEEDKRLVTARQQGFNEKATSWTFPSAESRYRSGISLIKSYQSDLRAGRVEKANINITNTDIETILLAITERVMEVPHGRLNARNFEVAWYELDDRVFFAQGAAIVARDALVAMRYAFEDKIIASGAMENMNQAIDSLEGAVNFHPWWVMRGDGDAMFADHRAKMSRYYTDARKRIKDVADAINR